MSDKWVLVANMAMFPLEVWLMCTTAPATGFILLIATLVSVCSLAGARRS